MDYNRIDTKIIDFINSNQLYKNNIDQNMYNDIFINYKNGYISPNEIFLLIYNDKINRSDLVRLMFKYKIKTTWLGLYVISVYENWTEDCEKLNIYIPGKTYAIVFEGDVKDNEKKKMFMYGTLDNFIVMKRIFTHGKLIIEKEQSKFKNDHDSPIVHPKKNKKRGIVLSNGNNVRIFNGPFEQYWERDYMLYHRYNST